MNSANKNGYSIIRILQMDVCNDKSDWKEELIKFLIKNNEVTNFFIGSQIEKYDKYIESI